MEGEKGGRGGGTCGEEREKESTLLLLLLCTLTVQWEYLTLQREVAPVTLTDLTDNIIKTW